MSNAAANENKIKNVWAQAKIPVAWRRTGRGEHLLVKLPFAQGNRHRLRNGRRVNPSRNAAERCWELPKAWFNDLIERALNRFGTIYVIQPYREQEKCSPACLNATGHECECSCMGQNHGAGNDGSWFEVTETFATRWGPKEWACLLLTRSARPVQVSAAPHILSRPED